MSMYDDIRDEIVIDDLVTRQQVELNAMRGFWKMRDGKKIHVSDMSESHIRNTIKFIQKVDHTDLYLPWINRFKNELRERGLE